MSDLALNGFLRIVTHPKVFDRPSTWEAARGFADAVRTAANAVPVAPESRHWAIFLELAEAAGARGNALPDTYLAALAIESGCEWITADRGGAPPPPRPADPAPTTAQLVATIEEQWPHLQELLGFGADSDSLISVAAVGLVEQAWRNSPLEDAHALRRGPRCCPAVPLPGHDVLRMPALRDAALRSGG